MKHLSKIAVMAVVLYCPLAHAASPVTGLYVEGQVGDNFARNNDLEGKDGFTGTSINHISYNDAATVSGIIGYHLDQNFRVEGELGYRKNELDKANETFGAVSITGLHPASSQGVTTVLANAWYDFKNTSRFTPYVGGGLGVAHINFHVKPSDGFTGSDSDTVFAYQLGAGVAYALTDHLDLTLGYRFLDTANADFKTTFTATGTAGTFSGDYTSNEVKAGVRYTF